MRVKTRVRLLVVCIVGLFWVAGLSSCRQAPESSDEARRAAHSSPLKPVLAAAAESPVPADSAPLTEVEPTLTIVYTNNIDGEIEPCG